MSTRQKNITVVTILISILTLYSVTAYAEIFQGEIKSINAGSGMVTVLTKDPATGELGTEELQVQASANTKLKNFASLNELRIGDEIQVDGNPDER